MSAPQMAQEFAGLAERKTLPVLAKARVSSVNLFLPARVFISCFYIVSFLPVLTLKFCCFY
jgi:hypothetical protein